MKTIIDKLLKSETIVIFDVDGVLAPYVWGIDKHCISDEEWNTRLVNGEDIYSTIPPIKLFQNFIQKKGIDNVYVCSKSGINDMESKRRFVKNNYGIDDSHICFVEQTDDKILYLDKLRDELSIPENHIAIVEDTVKTLDAIAAKSDYMTVHVSTFLMTDMENEKDIDDEGELEV